MVAGLEGYTVRHPKAIREEKEVKIAKVKDD